MDPESPRGKRFRERIRKFAKGSLAQAELGTIAQEDLSRTKAAEITRTNRQNIDDLFGREEQCMQMGSYYDS